MPFGRWRPEATGASLVMPSVTFSERPCCHDGGGVGACAAGAGAAGAAGAAGCCAVEGQAMAQRPTKVPASSRLRPVAERGIMTFLPDAEVLLRLPRPRTAAGSSAGQASLAGSVRHYAPGVQSQSPGDQ